MLLNKKINGLLSLPTFLDISIDVEKRTVIKLENK